MARDLAAATAFGGQQRRALQDLSRKIDALPQGIVKEFPSLTNPVSVGATYTAITGTVRFTFERGRRYLVRGFLRAVQNAGAANDVSFGLFNGATDLQPTLGGYLHGNTSAVGIYTMFSLEWPVKGAGQAYTALHVRANSTVTKDFYTELAAGTALTWVILDEGRVDDA